MCKVSIGYHGISEIEHGLCVCKVDNPLATVRGLSLHIGAHKCSISHLFLCACIFIIITIIFIITVIISVS